MMLRASIEQSGMKASLNGITEGAKGGDAGIQHGERLTAFADAALGGDSAALDTAREALLDEAGFDAVVDAAAVIGNFERMVRIADGTGIPLDGVMETLSEDLRLELGLDEFATRRVGQRSLVARLMGPTVRRLTGLALRIVGRWNTRKAH